MDYDGHSLSAIYDSNLWNLTTCTISVFGTLHETNNWLLPHDVEFLTFYPKKWAEDPVKKKWSNGKLKKNKNGTRITAWAALPAVWQTNKAKTAKTLLCSIYLNLKVWHYKQWAHWHKRVPGPLSGVWHWRGCPWGYLLLLPLYWYWHLAGHWQWRACLCE